MVDCNDTSYVEMLCKGCTKHYCVCHRHHGCLDHFSNAEIKKQKVHEMKAPKIKFQLAKDEADKKVILSIFIIQMRRCVWVNVCQKLC